jgi:hypothetical protein
VARKTVQLSAEDLLTAVPYANETMKLDMRQDGSAVASVPMKKPKWVDGPLGMFLPYSTHKRVELDPIGVAVIGLCDGKRRVEQVVEEFARENLLSWRESQMCVMPFLRLVTERGLIVIVGSSKDNPGKS